MKIRTSLVISVLLVAIAATACGGGGEAIPTGATPTYGPTLTSTPISPTTAEQLLEQARELERQRDYEAAIEKYQAFIDADYYVSEDGEYFSSYDAEKAIGTIYIGWAEQLEGQGQYDEAIEKYQAFIDGDYYISRDGEYFSSYDAEKAIGTIYIGWAEQLEGQGEYDEAIEKYQAFIDGDYYVSEDGEYFSSYDAKNAIGAIYATWAEQLESQGLYGEAVEKYQAFVDGDYYFSEHGDYFSSYDAEKAIGAIYIAWAEQLEGQGLYGEAAEKYQAFIDGDYYISVDGDYFSSYDAEERMGDCRYLWGQRLQAQGDYEAAIAEFAAVPPRHDYYEAAQEALPGCHYSWVMQLKAEGQHQQAIQEYVWVLEQYPTTAWASGEKGDELLTGIPASDLLQSVLQLLDEERMEGAAWVCEALLDSYPASAQASSAQQALGDAVDAYVAVVAGSQHGELPSFTATSEPAGGKATVQIRNACPYILTVSFSGPESRALYIGCHPEAFAYVITPFGNPTKYKQGTIQLQPGQYQIVAKVNDPSIAPWYGTMTLTQDQEYTTYFYILQTWG